MPAARAVPLWPQPGGRPMLDRLHQMVAQNRAGQARALVSVCSAHPDVLRASLNWAERGDRPIIIETTSNQVNQDGGYTGTTPADFAREIFRQADIDCAVEDIPTSAYPTPARRPANSRLDCTSLTETFGIARPDWRRGLTGVLKELDTA